MFNKYSNPSGERVTTKLFDLSFLEEMDDNGYIIDIVTIFLDEAPSEIKEIADAIKKENPELVVRKAHKLKNSAAVLQANQLVTLLDTVEKSAKANKNDDEFLTVFTLAQKEYKELESALRIHLRTIKT